MSVADILIGPISVFYAPVGEAMPAEDLAYGGDWAGNWTKIAMTQSPLSMNRDVSTGDIRIEQSTLVVKRVVTEETVALEIALSEFVGDHIQLGLGGTVTTTAAGVGQVGFEELKAGGAVKLTERTWAFEGMFVDANDVIFPVRLQIWRATSVLNGSLTFGKSEETAVPLRIDAMGDLAKPVGEQLLRLIRVTEAAQ